MKKIALATSMLLAIASGSAMAHGENAGYLVSANDGSFVRDGNGNCIMTPNSTLMEPATDCMTAAPAVEEEMAKPAEPKMVDANRKFAVYFDFNSTKVGSLS